MNRPPALAHVPRVLESELFLIAGPTADALPARIARLQRGLHEHPSLPLRDFAYSVSRGYNPHDACLAIVAESHADLDAKLTQALTKLQDPACARIQDKRGIYYYRDRLGQSGKVAWMFPGEGAQYLNMLQDLCLQVPDVRATFDLIDLACRREDANFIPSAHVFPPPGSLPSANGGELYTWDAAVMAVVGANTALLRLFRDLRVPAHATVGHSFGEFAALELGGILRPREDQRLDWLQFAVRHIRQLSSLGNIPEAVLLNIGGAEPAQIEAVVAQHAPDLMVAMANCPHQHILCATGDARASIAEAVIKSLGAEGAICTPLPFHRPYHTHHFAPAMPYEREFYTQADLHPPTLDVYSCTTADRFPADAPGIIDVATRHWASPVRFADTITRMFADGVRIFLEVGPRGNLCAFVDDILRDQPHIAIPVDREHRSTRSQLHRALGMLAAHGVCVDVEPLHALRNSRALDPDTWAVPPDDSLKRLVDVGMHCRYLDAAQYVKEVGPLQLGTRESALPAPITHAAPSAPPAPAPTPVPPMRDQVMAAYFTTMNQFLASQELMLGTLSQVVTAPVPTAPPPPAARPMVGTVVAHQPGSSIDIVKTFDVDHDRFLRDHTLGTRISAYDPDLHALPIMPLLFSLELMGEVALALCPEARVVLAHEELRANRWIFFERGRVTLHTTAHLLPSTDGVLRVRAEIREVTDPQAGPPRGPCSVETTVVLGQAYPPPPTPPRLALQQPEATAWTGTALYPQRTFHGPRFQGIRRVDHVGANGLIGELTVLPRDVIFHGEADPAVTFDPLLADCMGQAIWVWGNKNPDAPHFFLPFYVGALRFTRPPLPPGTPLALDLELRAEADPAIVSCDVRALDSSGALCTEIVNLRDRAFAIPLALKRMLLQPLLHAFSETWTPPPHVQAVLRGRWTFTRIAGFPRSVLESSYGVWRRAWAFVVLNPPEREQWLALTGPVARQLDWLWGRTCAKDAVRALLHEAGRPTLGAADISLSTEAAGRPIVAGGWRHDMPARPAISIAHADGVALAAACLADASVQPGIDLERIRPPSNDLRDGAFTPAELDLLKSLPGQADAWFFRAWAAKESVGKSLGTGVLPTPHAFRLIAADASTGSMRLMVNSRILTALTFQDGDYAVAICQGAE